MPHCRIHLYFLLFACLSISVTAQALDFRSGEYELELRQSVKGMPAGMGTVAWRECLTQTNPIPTQYLQAHSCDLLESHTVYHTLHYKLSCYTDHGTLTNEGKVHFSRMKIHGNSRSDVGDVRGEKMVVRYKFKGRRIGDCH